MTEKRNRKRTQRQKRTKILKSEYHLVEMTISLLAICAHLQRVNHCDSKENVQCTV